jgi:very-short-patch-repair endonuclease
MINEIYIGGKLVVSDSPKNKFKSGFEIRCIKCSNLIKRNWFDKKILENPYECKSCVLKYKNPMYSPDVKEKHDKIMKSKEYRENMSNITSGERNGFYGKTHTADTMKVIKDKLKFYWDNMDTETHQKWSSNASERERRKMKDDPIRYIKQKSNAARASHKSQFKNKKMNEIEKKVYDYLNLLGLNFDYSPILASYQYDFIIRNQRILIEVDGDYWHGNPKYYNVDGTDGKRKLNEIQLSKIDRDTEKSEWAKSRGFEIIRIWEDEINNNSYKDKLNEIKKN